MRDANGLLKKDDVPIVFLMRKIIVSNYVTLDGFFAGPNGEIDRLVRDEETAKYSKDPAATNSMSSVFPSLQQHVSNLETIPGTFGMPFLHLICDSF